MPSAPKSWQFIAAVNTFGIFPPRAFLRVAILLILTLNFVIIINIRIIRIVIVMQNYYNWFFFTILVENKSGMVAKDLISEVIPSLKTSDLGQTALNWMEIFRVSHLPIVNNQDFLGLISDTEIYDMNQPEEPIGNHALTLFKPYVDGEQHIFEVIGLASRLKLSVVPVLDNNKHFKGVITTSDLIRHLAGISSMDQPGGIIVLELIERDYS